MFIKAFIPLCRYFWRHREHDAIIVASDYPAIMTLLACRLTGNKARIVVNSHITLSQYAQGISVFKRLFLLIPRVLYPLAYAVANVSEAAAQDAERFFRLPHVHTLYNPLVRPETLTYVPIQPPHPWLKDDTLWTVVACGRLSHQKNYPLMLQAFTKVVAQKPHVRLLILGSGEREAELKALAHTLKLDDTVSFVGNVPNAPDYMYFARCLWLTSAFEGLPTVMIEALATGTPCVAVNCPSGPREILQNNTYGRLVESMDATANAQAMLEFMDAPRQPRAHYKARAADFSVETGTQAYLDLLAR
jgi:glycosyltransferase involved in cell wall biosynthesis